MRPQAPGSTVDVLAGLADDAPDDCVVAPRLHRGAAFLANVRRKISARLADALPLDTRRLVNRGPLVSFTFDDAPESAHSRGAVMLERSGARGTYYIATALIGRKTRDWTHIGRDGVADLHLQGHEIALHTHRHQAVGWLTAQELRADLEENRAELQRIHSAIDPQNFAYPFGAAAFARKRQLSSLVRSSRGVKAGINAGAFDAQFLKCVVLADARLTPANLERCLDAVAAQNGWLIFLTHDVSAAPSPLGCSTGLLRRALDGVAERGITVVTVAEALRQSRACGARGAFFERRQVKRLRAT
jgi:peptidoglycan/xylan/chitin deacetylase (PgdA/CDA1 family)